MDGLTGNQGGATQPTGTPGQAGPATGFEGTPVATPAPIYNPAPPPPPPIAAPAPSPVPAAPAALPGTNPAQVVPPGPVPTGGVAGTGVGSVGGTPTDGWTSLRDAAKAHFGVDLSQFTDDQAALQHLISIAQNGSQYQAAAQRYMQNAAQFETWMQQQAAATQQAAKPTSWWNPPEFQPSWEHMLTRDGQGNPTGVIPGADPSILPKYLAFRQYRRDFADRLVGNPAETLQPFIDQRAKAQAQQLIDQNLGQYRDAVWADQFVAQNSTWLHTRDQAGNVVRDPGTGQPYLSPAGSRFRDYVVSLHKSGITDIRQQQEIARGLVERDLLSMQHQQRAQQLAGAQQQQALLAQNVPPNALHNPSLQGSFPAVHPAAQNQPPQNVSLSLRDQLAASFAANGITDASIAADLAGRPG